MGLRETKFSDVCGTIDDLRNMLSSGRPQQKESCEIPRLLEDALYMIGRMWTRLKEYEGFREELRTILRGMDEIGPAGVEKASNLADELKGLISKWPLEGRDFERTAELAEGIRGIANSLEGALSAYKRRCLDMVELYGRVKDARDWSGDEEKRLGIALPMLMPLDKVLETIRGWLPPEPHRTELIEFIRAGRAHIQPRRRGEPPMVQFEDGGTISLHKVRYAEKIRNFYPVDSPPAREV